MKAKWVFLSSVLFAGLALALSGSVRPNMAQGPDPQRLAAPLQDYWSLTGDAGTMPPSNFLGTTDDEALELHVNSARALRLEPHYYSPNLIGGYSGNWVTDGVWGATIGGGGTWGGPNSVTDTFGTVAGGVDNTVAGWGATVGGGGSNTASNEAATIGGGSSNEAHADYATVGGGYLNVTYGLYSTIGGGADNFVNYDYAAIGGGRNNQVYANYGTVAGGGGEDSSNANIVYDDYGTIGGGSNNTAGTEGESRTDAAYATVGGGFHNHATADFATVGGGDFNVASGPGSTVAGGFNNVASGSDATVLGGSGNMASGDYSFAAGSNASAVHLGAFVWSDSSGGYPSTADNQFAVRATGGVVFETGSESVQVNVLEIVGGSDLAEPFEIFGVDNVQPGMVVAIDPERPGQLRLADIAYDRMVTGCVSGANGVNPGLTMGQAGTAADGSFPVALSGRVYCWADASHGPIQPGDLLTTSDTPGHVMAVTDYELAQGAIIGKAMSALAEGRGLVLVLVSLQ